MHRPARLAIRPLGVPLLCEQVFWRLLHALCDERVDGPPIGAAAAGIRRRRDEPSSFAAGLFVFEEDDTFE